MAGSLSPRQVRTAHLHTRLAEVDAPGQLLAHEGVGVVRALEHALQRLQLAAVERGAVPPLLLLPLGGAPAPRAGTFTCGGAKGQQVGGWPTQGVTTRVLAWHFALCALLASPPLPDGRSGPESRSRSLEFTPSFIQTY